MGENDDADDNYSSCSRYIDPKFARKMNIQYVLVSKGKYERIVKRGR